MENKEEAKSKRPVEIRIKIISETDGIITFGTNKGLKVSEVDDTNYLEWSLKNVPFEKRTRALFERRLAELTKVENSDAALEI